ncbi:hypoxanthine phosphoribosyltransferase [Clostridium argentinense CDC 2741]|uniref:Hypoxanthine phosphoribosyltransferase n=1 Tax=Clostridium argentinense CDC 2741 TaxID=1418104 RepID=A0A0C1TYC7_9CLOT|nr:MULTISPECIES: hypoxanthine phosphoribosyltransferase [Clostridium]ARC83619.1 hypoxanthine phosphoribosyltransferase [Clostridium argentinense]KIE45709.1 hypoxanthine phosphoribosyltransferase [Clostridium argentinense CDC 2741]NFF41688.1 hypoxanthine phosphoribosyltransferase [Clostridium argentinense]NFP52414.1 hypoxanthine phosphoribosyltransferase [Clostridium argentinense]NFP74715.1 hypoxanthine phosphoribosyltransferase [Clostridium argentinense]
MYNDIKEVLLTEEQIKEKVKELATRISEDYKGKDLLVLGILKGSVIFMSDLLKEIKIPCMMDFMAVSSYGASSESSGIVKILKDLDFEVKGKHVLIVEDIIDSGITLKYLMKYLGARNPESLEIACLLNKPDRRKEEMEVKYLGFDVPDYFLVGYGLDYAEKYRNLPYVAILKESVYKK